MRWRKGIDHNQIRSEDDRYVIYRDGERYTAWGPVGSQDVSYIQAHTAAVLREQMRMERQPGELEVVAGRALIGVFGSGDQAREGCEGHRAETVQEASI